MTTSVTAAYPATIEFHADTEVDRWRPLAQWALAVPHLAVAWALSYLRSVLTLISLVTVLFTKRIPKAIFGAIAMTYRYEWRAVSYAMCLHADYPPFDFTASAEDDEVEPHTALTIAYPAELSRWKPLYKWLLAVPHYVVAMVRCVIGCLALLFGFVAVIATGRYPTRARDYLVNVARYVLRVQAYVGLLTDRYPPFHLPA